MYFVAPEDISMLVNIFKPYMRNNELKNDAPKEAVDAYKEFNKWFDEKQPYGEQ